MPSQAIEIVAIPEQYLACLRAQGPVSRLADQERALRQAFLAAGIAPAGALLARFYGAADADETDFEVCLPLRPDDQGWVPDTIGDAVVTITPAHHAMATTHAGSRATIAAAHTAIRRELETLGYVQAGPACETYVGGLEEDGGTADAERLTVVSYPYAR